MRELSGNHSLWPTLACFDLQPQRQAQSLFVDSSLAASTHCVAATQVLWCSAGLFRPYMITLHHPSLPPSPDLRVLAAAVCSFYCLEIGFFLTALIGCVEDYLCVTHPFSARRPAPRPELPGDDSSCCYSGVGTRAQSRNSCMHVAWFLAARTLVPLELPELLQARLIQPV